jgi:hypothetical protein
VRAPFFLTSPRKHPANTRLLCRVELFLNSGWPDEQFACAPRKLIFYTSNTPLCVNERVSARAYPKITRIVPGDVWCRARPNGEANFSMGIGLVKNIFQSFQKIVTIT